MKSIPYYCPLCKREGSYYGRLVFPGQETEAPTCPSHRKGFTPPLVPAVTSKFAGQGPTPFRSAQVIP